jgi:hypothetical protein
MLSISLSHLCNILHDESSPTTTNNKLNKNNNNDIRHCVAGEEKTFLIKQTVTDIW